MEKMRPSRTIVLGYRVEDRVSGLRGIAVARVEYLNGCIQFCVQPRGATDALRTDSLYIDEGQLRVLGPGVTKSSPQPLRRDRGGPSAHAPKGLGRSREAEEWNYGDPVPRRRP